MVVALLSPFQGLGDLAARDPRAACVALPLPWPTGLKTDGLSGLRMMCHACWLNHAIIISVSFGTL